MHSDTILILAGDGGMRTRESMKLPDLLQTYYIKLPGGPPTQGDIWTNLPSPFLNLAAELGLVITPRCDLAHDKARFVNYLPLLPLHDYLCTQGGFGLLEQELYNAKDKADVIGRELGVDRLLAAGVSLNDALAVAQETIGPVRWKTRKVQAKLDDLRQVTARAELLAQKLGEDRLDPEVVATLISPRALAVHKRQIARNSISDLHFLPPCPPLFHKPAVVLLRCIGTCGKELITAALHCVTQQDWERALKADSVTLLSSFRDKPDRIARLRTPYLEALMARFGALFTRVGTRDIPDEAIVAMTDEG